MEGVAAGIFIAAILFVISYSRSEDRHMLHTVPATVDTFDARADLPETWAGLREADLALTMEDGHAEALRAESPCEADDVYPMLKARLGQRADRA